MQRGEVATCGRNQAELGQHAGAWFRLYDEASREHVVGSGAHQSEHGNQKRLLPDECENRQAEDVETHVPSEERVDVPERLGVEVLEPVEPVGRQRQPSLRIRREADSGAIGGSPHAAPRTGLSFDRRRTGAVTGNRPLPGPAGCRRSRPVGDGSLHQADRQGAVARVGDRASLPAP